MKGKNVFTKAESEQIKDHLTALAKSGRYAHTDIRVQLRLENNFYISDFDNSRKGFSAADFDRLVAEGLINIQ